MTTKDNQNIGLIDYHRLFAMKLTEEVLKLLNKANRTDDDNDLLETSANAIMYHCQKTGEPEEQQRGAWLLSKVYAVLQNAKKALFYAKKCLRITKEHRILKFNLAIAYELMSNALNMNNQPEQAWAYHQLALDIADLTDKEPASVLVQNRPYENLN